MKMQTNNRIYILIIILLVILNIYLLVSKLMLSDKLYYSEKERSYYVEQIGMIEYISANNLGISNYSNMILEDRSLLYDKKTLIDNKLEHFLEPEKSGCSISILDDTTVYYIYKYMDLETDLHKIYSFYYVSEVNDINTQYTEDCILIDDNIFVKPYELFGAGYV